MVSYIPSLNLVQEIKEEIYEEAHQELCPAVPLIKEEDSTDSETREWRHVEVKVEQDDLEMEQEEDVSDRLFS